MDESLQKMKAQILAKNAALSAVSDFLSDLILKSGAPEEQKIGVRIIRQARRVERITRALVDRFADPEKNVPYSDAKQVCEYLQLVECGLEQFLETFEDTKFEN